MILILLLFRTAFGAKKDYITSIFGRPGQDEIDLDMTDGFEVLQTGLPRPKTRSATQAPWIEKINPEHYPWPGHTMVGSWEGHDVPEGTCDWTTIQKESTNMNNVYKFTNMTQADLYRHPVASKQFYTTDEEIDQMDRVKVRYVTTPKYNRHYPPIFIPPGEIATIEIKESAVNKISVSFNRYCRWIPDVKGAPKFSQRYPHFRIDDIKIDRTVSTVGHPFGIHLNFGVSGNDPIEMNISGGVLCPFFKYGLHSDEEWENHLSKLPGPVAVIETGNILINVPSKFIRDTTRMNDCMRFYRSAYQISQTTAKDPYNNYDPRPINVLELHHETFVPAGAAVAFVGGNFCHFPPSWINGMIIWESAQDVPWGVLHEMNHHHQSGWGMFGNTDEMSNNILNLVIIAQTNQGSSPRYTSGWGSYTYSAGKLNDHEEYGLSMYSNMLHFFGIEKMRKFIRTDQSNNDEYKRETYGRRGAEMLRASKIFGRNMRYHFNFHNYNDSTISEGKQIVWDELNKLNLPMFHPVTNIYTVGFIVDGVRFISARPYRIRPLETSIDFKNSIITRENKEWFGDHEFKQAHFEKGRESAWKEISKGSYMLTPKPDITEIEEVIVDYLDKKTNQITQAICQFAQINNFAQLELYTNIGKISSVFDGYNMTKNLKPKDSYAVQGIRAPFLNTETTGWIAVVKGIMVVPESKDYVFALAADDQGLFYLSDKPLAFDVDIDEPYLINYQNPNNFNYLTTNRSSPQSLIAEKEYHFCLVIYNTPGASNPGQGVIGYQTGPSSFADVPASWLKYKPADDKQIFMSQYAPKFQNMLYMDEWDGTDFIPNKYPNWETYKYPFGDCIINSNSGQGSHGFMTISQCLTDGNPFTEYRSKWWNGDGPVPPFPHVYDTDIGETAIFSEFKIGGAGNKGWFDTDGYIEIRLAPYNYSIIENGTMIPYEAGNYSLEHNESIIYYGNYNTSYPIIRFDKKLTGRYLRLTVINNSKKWKDGHPGRSCISALELGIGIFSKKIYPITNRKIIKFDQEWKETRGGVYYNGRGFTGTESQAVEICVLKGRKEFGILGDYYPGMGTASVSVDGKYVGKIGESITVPVDNMRLNLSSRSHKTVLFYDKLDPNANHMVRIKVEKGSITLAGYLADEPIISDPYFNPDVDDKNNYNVCKFGFDAAAEEATKKKKKTVTIVGVVFGLIGAAALAVAGFFVYKKFFSDSGLGPQDQQSSNVKEPETNFNSL